MSRLTDEELKVLFEKSKKASSGPWKQDQTCLKLIEDEKGHLVTDTSSINDSNFITSVNPDTIKSLVTELLELRESDRRKTEALENAREGFALMAEGEGEDHQVYMEMSSHHMNQCDAALSGKDAG